MRRLVLIALISLPCLAQTAPDPDGLEARRANIATIRKILNDPAASAAQKEAAGQTALMLLDMDTQKMIHYNEQALAAETHEVSAVKEELSVVSALTNVAPQTPSAPTSAGSWRQVASFSGKADKETEPFTIDSSRWRIKWSCGPSAASREMAAEAKMSLDQVGAFSCWLLGAGADIDDNMVMGVTGSGGDTSEKHGTGTYHFKVNSVDDDWTVTVEEFSPGN